MKQISIEIIHKCPNRCLHCSSLSSPLCKDFIPKEVIFDIVDGAKRIGTEVLSISGGEPFLHKGLVSIVEYAKKQGLDVYVYSSGIYVDEYGQVSSLPQNVLIDLKSKGIDKIIFDLPAINESTYNKFMGTKGHLQYALNSINVTKGLGIFTEIHFVPTKINVNEIDDILSYAKNQTIDRVSFFGISSPWQGKRECVATISICGRNGCIKRKVVCHTI